MNETWRRRRRVAGVLVAALSDDRRPVRLAPGDGAALIQVATTHRVAGYVHRALQESGAPLPSRLDPGVTERLGALSVQAAAAHLRTLADLGRLQSLLDGQSVRWCVFKGPAVAELLHGSATLRQYTDLDVLVAPTDLTRVLVCLEDAGAEILDEHWRTLTAWQHTQIHLRLWSGTTLDLHWHLLNEWYDRDAFTLDTDALLRRVRRADVGGVNAPTLDPVDTLVNLCVHAATAGGQRLGWLRDIQLAARARGVDQVALAHRTATSGTALVTATMLCMAATALADGDLLAMGRRLSPSPSWTRLAVAVAHRSPAPRWRGREHVTLGWVLCRATRQSVGRSVLIILPSWTRLLRRWTTTMRVRAALRPLWERVRRPPAGARALGQVLPGDGPHAREAYLDWVAGSAGATRPARAGRGRQR